MKLEKEKDLFRVWLTLRSESLTSSSQVERSIGMPSNTAPLKAMQGSSERRSFSLQSDLALADSKNLEEHLNWMRKKCENRFDKISEFLAKSGNSGELSIYVISNQAAAYVDISSQQIVDFVNSGLDISVKFEVDQEV